MKRAGSSFRAEPRDPCGRHLRPRQDGEAAGRHWPRQEGEAAGRPLAQAGRASAARAEVLGTRSRSPGISATLGVCDAVPHSDQGSPRAGPEGAVQVPARLAPRAGEAGEAVESGVRTVWKAGRRPGKRADRTEGGGSRRGAGPRRRDRAAGLGWKEVKPRVSGFAACKQFKTRQAPQKGL